MVDKSAAVQVEIFGQSYTVRAGADPSYVQELASYVDSQMQQVSRAGGAVDSVRIAVLAALNIADECFRYRTTAEEAESVAHAHADELAKRLDAALAE